MTAEEIARLKANYQRQPQKYTLEFLSYLIQIQDFEQVCSILDSTDEEAANIMANYWHFNKKDAHQIMDSFYLSIINTNDIKFVSDCFNAPLLDRLLLRMYPQAKIKSLKQVIDSDNPELFMMVLDKVVKGYQSPIEIIGRDISKYIFEKHAWNYLDKILENSKFAECFFDKYEFSCIIRDCIRASNYEGLKKISELGIFSNKEYDIDEALEFAAQKDLETFEFMLELGADIQSGKNQAALLYLSTQKNWAYIYDLIERYSIDLSQSQLIFMAAQYGDISTIEKLVSLGADLFFKTSDGINAIHYALQSYNIDNLNYLLGRGLEVDISPECKTSILFSATYSLDLLKELSKKLQLPLNVVDQRGNTLLHTAILNAVEYSHNLELAEYLISQDFNINATNQGHLTPLTQLHQYWSERSFGYADKRYHDFYNIFEFLLNHNADPNLMVLGSLRGKKQSLISAICNSNCCPKEIQISLIKLLIDHGAIIDKTAAKSLIYTRKWEVIEYAIDNGKFYDRPIIIIDRVKDLDRGHFLIHKLFDKNHITVQDLQELHYVPMIYHCIFCDEFQEIEWLHKIGYDIAVVIEREFNKKNFLNDQKRILSSFCLFDEQQFASLQENCPESISYIEMFKQIFADLQDIFTTYGIMHNNVHIQKKLLMKFLFQLSFDDSQDLEKIHQASLGQFADFVDKAITSESIRDVGMFDETLSYLNSDSKTDMLVGENFDSDA